METLIEQMLYAHNPKSREEKMNALKETIQEIILYALSKTDFFHKAAFYGGTALRIFYNLDRYSEDLDFSLKEPNESFELEKYFPAIENEISSFGLNMKAEKKNKSIDSSIKSAFLKGNTKEMMLLFSSSDDMASGINPDALIKIKFEIDVTPPSGANFEVKYHLTPIPYQVLLYDEASLFAGKIAAIITRSWKNRIKGRDLYDYVFYMQREAKFNIKHLEGRLKESKFIDSGKNISLEDVKAFLCDRFDAIDYEKAKADVFPFVKEKRQLDIWSADFFKKITEKLKRE